jgi:preprotein translocase subunit YajC
MSNPQAMSSTHQAWLQSLQKGDHVLVHIKGESPFKSTVKNTNEVTIEVKDAGITFTEKLGLKPRSIRTTLPYFIATNSSKMIK